MHAGQQSLQEAASIGLIGDVHGDIEALTAAIDFLAKRDVHVLVALGDLGLLWNNGHWQGDVKSVSQFLSSRGSQFFWIEGNHDAYNILNSFPIDGDGLRRIAPNIIHMPRGYRTRLSSGMTLGAFGGANSIDKDQRSAKTWWPEESITEADLAALGDEKIDVLLSHDVALDVPTLDRHLAATDKYWSTAALEYARQGRAMAHRAFLATRPQVQLAGHYHVHIDEVVGYVSGSSAFAARVVVLDMVQHAGAASAAILDVETLELSFFTYFGKPMAPKPAQVTELTMASERRWMVHTMGSRHLFDFDAGTVERLPGPDAIPTTSDGAHFLRTLDTCAIGARGRWTMMPDSDDFETDYLWHVSSVIRAIEPIPASDS